MESFLQRGDLIPRPSPEDEFVISSLLNAAENRETQGTVESSVGLFVQCEFDSKRHK